MSEPSTPTIIMPRLNLPPFTPRLTITGGKPRIWDSLRQRYVALTPEEWVRQHFVSYLTASLDYPTPLMANEVSIDLNGMSRRCDTVVYDTQLRPLMIVEYKRPGVKITQKVFSQISRYNLTMRVDYLTVSNGLQHFCCKMHYESGTYTFLENIPQWSVFVKPNER